MGIFSDSNFWNFIWLIVTTFVFVAYLLVLFQIIVDLFRDKKLGGFSKAIWFIGLIFLPFLTALVYIIFRGGGMAGRQMATIEQARSESEAYIRSIAGSSKPGSKLLLRSEWNSGSAWAKLVISPGNTVALTNKGQSVLY